VASKAISEIGCSVLRVRASVGSPPWRDRTNSFVRAVPWSSSPPQRVQQPAAAAGSGAWIASGSQQDGAQQSALLTSFSLAGEITADRVVTEFARIAFADMRDYWPKKGETLDLHRLDQDRTAAVEEFTVVEAVDTAGVLRRQTRLKLHDKIAALTSLARHLGMFTDGVGYKSSIEATVAAMTPEERVACANEMLERAQKYLPQYEEWERKRSRED
jgi:Terminase small subunit